MHKLTRNPLKTVTLLVVVVALLALASTALAAVVTASNSDAGYADDDQITRSVTINDTGNVLDVNVSVDFQKISTEDCANPLSDTGWAYNEEISMSLTSPSGTIVALVYDDDHAMGPTYTESYDMADRLIVTFDDAAATQVGGPLPVAGAFRPEEPLAAFDGETASGTWMLTLGDNAGADYLCYYGFTLEVTTDTVVETPTVQFCSVNDGSLNAVHCGRPVAIYADGAGFAIYGIDINTGDGAMASEVTAEMIDAAGIPADGAVIIAEGQNPYNYRPFTLYRLPSGEFQLNTFYWDGKPYNVKWSAGDGAVDTVNW